MKVEVEKSEKSLGFTHLARLENLRLSSMPKSIGRATDSKHANEELEREMQRAEGDWEQYQKPGFRTDRPIKIVPMLPTSSKDETIYVVFKKLGYSIRSGRNFVHTPVIQYGNLRYASISELEYSEKEVLDDLREMNNGIILQS